MLDDEEYTKRDPRLPNTSINKDEDGDYHYHEPLDHGLMPYSFFVLARIVLGIALIIAIPFIIFDFSNSIATFLKLAGLFTVVTIISKVFGFTYLD